MPAGLSKLGFTVTCALSIALMVAVTGVVAAADISVTLHDPQWSASTRSCRFSFGTLLGRVYPVEVSNNGRDWTLLTNVIGKGGTMWVEDRGASNLQRRFYHVGVATKPPAPTPIANMVHIEPGTFTMGSADSEPGRDAREGPATVVTISYEYWIGKYEVTQTEFVTVTGSNSSFFIYDGRLPVDFVNWNQATNYCQKLTSREAQAGRLPIGYRYRLPTEAEWEYACRAGRTTPFSVGDGSNLSSFEANFDGGFPYGSAATGPYLNHTTIVGVFAPNAWGLYDMHGNVWEWCHNAYEPYPGGFVTDPGIGASVGQRALRGGGFTSVGKACRSAKRDPRSPTYATVGQGFRVVLVRDL